MPNPKAHDVGDTLDHDAATPPEQRQSQRPSFTRRDAPIARLPFIGHWLLSIVLLVALPVGMLKLVELTQSFGMFVFLMPFALWPGVHLYWISVQRRLLDIGANVQWAFLIIPFIIATLINAYDGMMAILAGAQTQPTIPPMVSALLLLPAAAMHVALMVMRGTR